jgi:hypothetical protein
LGCQLPEEIPGDLLRNPLVWVPRGSILRSLQRPFESPNAILRWGPRSFIILVGARDEIVSIGWLEPCMDEDAEPGTACRRGPLAPRWVSFSDPLVSTQLHTEQVRELPGTVFSQPGGEVFARTGPAAPSKQQYPQCQWRLPVRIDL